MSTHDTRGSIGSGTVDLDRMIGGSTPTAPNSGTGAEMRQTSGDDPRTFEAVDG